MKNLSFLALFAVLFMASAAVHAENAGTLHGTYLKRSCTYFNRASANKLKIETIDAAYDKGLDIGFCSGFLLGLLNSNYQLSLKNDANHHPQFCPPKDMPVLEASQLLVRELGALPKEQLDEELGIHLAVQVFTKAWPCENRPAENE